MNHFRQKLKSVKKRLFGFGFLALLGLLFPNLALAGLDDWVISGIGWFVMLIVNFLGKYILLPLINLMVWLLSYNDFLNSYAVQIGWPLVRDLANMFFVIFLLAIAFSTILNISNYHYKNTLFKLLLMAILVNFSKTIMGLAIDFVQVITITFVNAFKSAAAITLANSFGVRDLLGLNVSNGAEISNFVVVAGVILAAVLLVVAIGVILALTAVLLLRILSLWVLVILSPLAFLMAAFPLTAKYASEFWSNFTKQLTTGLAIAFFMWLSLSILSSASSESVASEILGSNAQQGVSQDLASAQNDFSVGTGKAAKGKISEDLQWEKLYTFIITVALLMLSLHYAQQAGSFAGDASKNVTMRVHNLGSGLLKVATLPIRKPAQAALYGAGRLRQGAERLVLDYSTRKGTQGGFFRQKAKYFTKAGWEGFGKRGEELTKRSRDLAAAYAHDGANRLFTGGNVLTAHGLNMSEHQAKQTAEEYAVSGLEDLKHQFNSILKMEGSREKDDRLRGLFMIASKQAWVDDLESIPQIRDSLLTKKERQEIEDKENYRYNHLLSGEQKAKSDSLRQEGQTAAKEEGLKEGTQEFTDYVRQYIEDRKKQFVDQTIIDGMKEVFGSDDIYGGVELTSRQKQGDFFKFIATSSQTKQVSQEGLNLVYNHEENAFNNGHFEDIGYVRVAEEDIKAEEDMKVMDKKGKVKIIKKGEVLVPKGQLRMLKYGDKDNEVEDLKQRDVDGFTEADQMGVTEIGKRDPKVVAKGQKHTFGTVRADGTLGYGDAYYRRMVEIAGGSEAETHRINVLARTANSLTGGTAVFNPLQEITKNKKDFGIVEPSKHMLADVLARNTSVNGRKYVSRSYSQNGGSFVLNKPDNNGNKVLDPRTALQKGEGDMIFKIPLPVKDSKGHFIQDPTTGNYQYESKYIAIDPVSGLVNINVDQDSFDYNNEDAMNVKEFIDATYASNDPIRKRFDEIVKSPGFK